jgi:hypothetical protein
MKPGLLRAAKGVDHEAHEGHEGEPDRSERQVGDADLAAASGVQAKPGQPGQRVSLIEQSRSSVFFVSFVVDRSSACLAPTLV